MNNQKLSLSAFGPLYLCMICFFHAAAQPKLNLLPFVSGTTFPLDITHAGDNRLFIVQQAGQIRISDLNGNLLALPFLNITNKVHQAGGERGLLGLAFHPDYKNNGYFYVNYTRVSDGATVVSRFSVSASNPDKADSLSESILLVISQPYDNHNGGNVLFGPDGYLYVGMGDGGSGGDPQNYSQNTNSLLGKMLRIDVDNGSPYAIPADNPFVNNPSVLDEIWAIGLRNPWRSSFDRYTGDLWIADVGQNAWEEVNFQPDTSIGGKNYGWRCYESNSSYNLSGCSSVSNYTFPVFEYAHYGGSCSGSITGGYVYRGALHNGIFGKYIVADFCKGNFYWVERSGTVFSSGTIGTYSPYQYSSFGEDQYGELYVSLLNSNSIQKVTDTSDCRPVAKIMEATPLIIANSNDTARLHAFYHPSLDYQWKRNGMVLIPDTLPTLKTIIPGKYTVEVLNPANSCMNESDTVEVIMLTGINSPLSYPAAIQVYPNPANSELTIDGLLPGKGNEITLFNIIGEAIHYVPETYSAKVFIETGYLLPGVYLLKIKTGDDILIRKVIVQ